MDDNSEYEYYLSYYTEQSGGGLEHYQGRRYVPAGQEGGGLGDLFKAALPALTGLAKKSWQACAECWCKCAERCNVW